MAERIRSEIRACTESIRTYERYLSQVEGFPPECSEWIRAAIRDYNRAIQLLLDELAAL